MASAIRRLHRVPQVEELLVGPAAVGHVSVVAAQHRQEAGAEDRAGALVRTFSALYGAGVPIVGDRGDRQTAGNEVVNRAMEAVIESVKSGGSIAASGGTLISRRWSRR